MIFTICSNSLKNPRMLKYYTKALLLFSILCVANSLFASNATYEQRRTDYINNALTNFSNDAITIQAYMNVPVNQTALTTLINGLPTRSTVDFDIVKLIRILCLTPNGTYDAQILPALDSIPFWLRKDQWLYGYWSENHMIMWMSSDWLLHEKYGKMIDANLDNRLRHYLKLKVKYGFYEFFSSVYAPYCLSGLLNLADFSQDAEIKSLATQASVRLMNDLLLLTNDKGVFYPSAGRNYYSKYLTPYNQNHNNLIYLLTGMGQAPTAASHAGGFLASSSIFTDSITDSWRARLDTIHRIGHPIDSLPSIHKDMAQVDKIIFQWSAGTYFHPFVAYESVVMIRDSNLWNHVDFVDFKQFSGFSANDAPVLAEYASYASKSSVICGQDVAVFKRNGVVLSSVQDFWKGKLGYQQFPCVATIGTTPVITASGKINKDWNKRTSANSNEHLPYITQKKNVAMLMYRQENVPAIFTYKNPEVSLYFKDADFDEVRNSSNWILGRQDESYVAVRRACIDEIDSVRACPNPKGQTWVIVVGDSSMYANFNTFETVIQQSQFTDSWSLDTTVSPWQHNYYAKVLVDNNTLEYTWNRDSVIETSINEIELAKLTVYPNPAKGEFNINLSDFAGKNVDVKVINAMGQQVFKETILVNEAEVKNIKSNWVEGLYFVVIEGEGKRAVSKISLK